MPVIEVITPIAAPLERCFLLALSVDAHAASAAHTREEIVAGVRSGLLQLGDTVTFRARHLGVWQTLTSQITDLQAPTYFRDEMQRGAFKHMWHEHYFEQKGATTYMRDVFCFVSPLGWLGRLADGLVLKQYLQKFLTQRGAALKQCAETDAWQAFLSAA